MRVPVTAPARQRNQQPETAASAAALAAQTNHALVGLAAVIARALRATFAHVDLADSRSIVLFTRLVEAVVAKYAPAAGTLAARSYAAERQAAGVAGRFTPAPAPVPSTEDVQAAVEWAVRRQIDPEPDKAAFEVDVTTSAQKLVQDVARTTVIDNVKRDRQTSAWYRVVHPSESKTGTCAFCAMLAQRGPVYTEETADFQAHPGDKCTAAAVFPGYKPSAQVQAWQAMWQRHVKDAGRTGRNATAAFRQAVEGRPVTGLTRGPHLSPKRHQELYGKTRAETAPKIVRPTPEQAARMIDQFEASNARAAGNPKLAAMVKANDARLAELRQIIAQPL